MRLWKRWLLVHTPHCLSGLKLRWVVAHLYLTVDGTTGRTTFSELLSEVFRERWRHLAPEEMRLIFRTHHFNSEFSGFFNVSPNNPIADPLRTDDKGNFYFIGKTNDILDSLKLPHDKKVKIKVLHTTSLHPTVSEYWGLHQAKLVR